MTADVLERPAVAVRADTTYRYSARQGLTVLPWLVVAFALVVTLLATGTRPGDIASYAAYWALAVVLPGTLVHRAVRGSRGNLTEDLGYGAATGLLLELVAWASSAAVGGQHVLRWWPAPVVVAFLVVPRLRRHWRIEQPVPLPLRWTWGMAAVLLGIVAWNAGFMPTVPLPPVDGVYYQDLLYHLALVHEMTRSMPFEVPQVAGEALRYHYLSDAHLAAASMITGTSPVTVLFRLWIVPVAATAAVAGAALTREVAGRWWTGPLASAVMFIGSSLAMGAPTAAPGTRTLTHLSPSQTYAIPLLILLAAVVVDVLRGRRLPGVWVLVPPLALACAGAKSSALPPLAAGLLVAGVVVAWRERRVPWPVLGLLAAMVAAMALGFRLFAGGGAGTLQLQVLSLLRWCAPYAGTLGADDGIQPGGVLPAGLAGTSVAGWAFVVAVVAWMLLMQGPRLVGLAALGARRTRRDPVAWLLAGTVVAAAGATWAFYHPSVSQIYFFTGGAPFGVMLSVWLLAAYAGRWWVPVVAFGLGAAWVLTVPTLPRPADTFGGWLTALYLPVLWAAGAVALLVVLAVVTAGVWRRSRRAALRSALFVAVTAATLGGSSAGGSVFIAKALVKARPATAPPGHTVTAAEMRAALWLDANAAADDVVATNVHCRPVAQSDPCDARAFWVAGLGGRRTVVESWGYTDAAVAAHGRDGLRYQFQPPPDAAVFARNQRLFTSPTPQELAAFQRSYGVRWLVADARAGRVSPLLATMARLRFLAGSVAVYELNQRPSDRPDAGRLPASPR